MTKDDFAHIALLLYTASDTKGSQPAVCYGTCMLSEKTGSRLFVGHSFIVVQFLQQRSDLFGLHKKHRCAQGHDGD